MWGVVFLNLLGALTSAVQNEVALLQNVEEDIQKISLLLATIKAVVRDAEIQRLSKDAAEVYFQQLEDIAYELEDILDEWWTQALRPKMEESEGSSSSNGMASSFLSASSSCVSYALSYHDIGNKIKKIIEKLEFINKVREIVNLEVDTRERVERKYREEIIKKRETTSQVNTCLIVGREDDKAELVKLLKEAGPVLNEVPVISIVGMGGVGKTTLAQFVYNDEEVIAHFEKRMWVFISDNFDVKRIIVSILKSTTRMDCEALQLDQLQFRLNNILHKKRFLLVLDDIRREETESWNKLRLLLRGAPGSRIIITTHSDNVARAMHTTHMHKLGVLSDEHCWSLFHPQAFVQQNAKEYKLLEPIGRQIVNKCKGMPLAAKALGNAMSFKREKSEWTRVLESETWNSHGDLQDILRALFLSYHDLPYDIKQCFIYCSLFPKDSLIDKDRLVKLWVAQGFIHSDDSREMEEIAGLYFDDLLSRSLLQEENMGNVRGYDDIVRCKMHNVVHDLARFISKNSIAEIGKQTPNLSKARHSCLLVDALEGSILDVIYNAEKLRTLVMVNSQYLPGRVPDTLFQKLKCLRALDLRCSIKELSPDIGKLNHLRYLDLSYNESLEKLPEEVSNLCNLQTLKLEWCRTLRELPHGMSQMNNLRHLENRCTGLRYLPQGIRRLKELRTLQEFIVDNEDGKGCDLRELKDLNSLKGRLSIKKLENVSEPDEAREAELCKKRDLRFLELAWSMGRPRRKPDENHLKKMDDIAEALRPPHNNLEELTISDFPGSNFPKWMMDTLVNLVRVTLFRSPNCTQLPGLGKLPFLEYLGIRQMDEVRHIRNEFCGGNSGGSFPNLKELIFDDMPNWEDWELTSESQPMPSLRQLTLRKCPKLNRFLPNYHLLSLKRLALQDDNTELLLQGLLPTLPNLNHLTIDDNDGLTANASAWLRQFKALEILEIYGQPSSPQLAMRHTSELSDYCTSSSLPVVLQSLPNLQTLKIVGCPELAKNFTHSQSHYKVMILDIVQM